VAATDAPAARYGLHVHTVGERGDILDTDDYMRSAYELEPGQWVLVRPDGYVAAVLPTPELKAIETHLESAAGAHPRQ
jgi:hypothetical protein